MGPCALGKAALAAQAWGGAGGCPRSARGCVHGSCGWGLQVLWGRLGGERRRGGWGSGWAAPHPAGRGQWVGPPLTCWMAAVCGPPLTTLLAATACRLRCRGPGAALPSGGHGGGTRPHAARLHSEGQEQLPGQAVGRWGRCLMCFAPPPLLGVVVGGGRCCWWFCRRRAALPPARPLPGGRPRPARCAGAQPLTRAGCLPPCTACAGNVVVLVPVPDQTARAQFSLSAGKAKYDPKRHALIWKVGACRFRVRV